MGRSQTVHRLGIARDKDGNETLLQAMSRAEAAQERREAERDGGAGSCKG